MSAGTVFQYDSASLVPGPMGWGLNNQSLIEVQTEEKKSFDKLVATIPQCCYEKPARDYTQSPIYQKAIELQKADGIEDGFSFRYLERAIFGDQLRFLAQTIGSCVASGWMRAFIKRCLAEIMLLGQPEEFFGTDKPTQNSINSLCPFAPYNYGMGREVGGIDNGGDGSFCSAHVQAAMQFGAIPCWTPGLTQYASQFPEPILNQNDYKKWGDKQYRSVRAKFHSVAGDFKQTETIKVTSFAQSMEQLTKHLKPQMVCSGWGFAPVSKIPGTEFWIYKRSGSWAHNMTRQGALKISGNWYTDIENSWGDNAHKNGDWFLVPAEHDEQWIRDAEIQTIGELILPESRPTV